MALCNISLADRQVYIGAFLWQVVNRSNILFAQLKLVTTKPSVQNLFFFFCLHSVKTLLIFVDNDAMTVAMVCVRSVDMWNRDTHTQSRTLRSPVWCMSIRSWVTPHRRWNWPQFTHREIDLRSFIVSVLCTQNLCCLLRALLTYYAKRTCCVFKSIRTIVRKKSITQKLCVLSYWANLLAYYFEYANCFY